MVIQTDAFSIRSTGEAEAEAILGVYQQCEDFLSICPVPVASMQMVLEDLQHSSDTGGVFCAIYSGGDMVGVVDFVPDFFEGQRGTAYITLLMIAREHRGRGLGRKVVEAVESQIRRNPGITEICLGSQVNNTNGIAFWKRMGYEICSGPKRLPDTTVCYDLRKCVNRPENIE